MALPRRNRFEEAPVEAEWLARLETLDAFSRIVYRYGLLIAATGGVTVKAVTATRPTTTADSIIEYLRRINARGWDTGKSTSQIAKALGVAYITVRKAMATLEERGLVRSEKRGRNIHYFLP